MSEQTENLEIARLRKQVRDQGFAIDTLQRQVDEVIFAQRLADIAHVDLVKYTGPSKTVEPNPTAQGAGNPVIINAHVYVPKDLDSSRQHPLVLFIHGGVHARHSSSATNVVRELVEQGYTVVSPDYRGSTGYGQGFQEAIDYGGREVDDSYAAREWALEAYDHLDPARVGIIGWSHGGLITLFNIFDHPEDFAVAYAAVPVSDLIARMGYKSQAYRDLFSAKYHIGKTAEEDVAEYRRRSPSWNTDRYAGTPLLIHTNTNDEDVNVLEVERLIQALAASGHTVESKIYQDAPGGHSFNRLDTRLARESRREVWRFLAPHLNPQRPVE
ncbi:MAG TPA: alpha/beta fold hydrolase [Thermomicrobiales bacterium]|nr:alpha/beta fold hydrolase [Thermomicrobiales bacterium]